LGESGVHRRIEFEAWDVDDPDLFNHPCLPFNRLSNLQKHALHTYSGNWMRDFSQVFVPRVIDGITNSPKRYSLMDIIEHNRGRAHSAGGILRSGRDAISMAGRWIGRVRPITDRQGVEILVTNVLKALATLKFGIDIGNNIITPNNLLQYKPEDHIDNIAGFTWGDVLVKLDGEYVSGNAINPDTNQPPNGLVQARERDFPSRAFTGTQLDNAKLFNVGPLGLSFHIYNSSEFAKELFEKAKNPPHSRTSSPEIDALRYFGTGLHIIEDYFAHSNFIEVALNSAFNNNPDFNIPDSISNRFRSVDTLFTRPPDTFIPISQFPQSLMPIPLQSITTGTFGTDDTMVSISYALLPLVSNFFHKIDEFIDEFLALTPIPDNISSWQGFVNGMDKPREARAMELLIQGIDAAGYEFEVPTLETRRAPDVLRDLMLDESLHPELRITLAQINIEFYAAASKIELGFHCLLGMKLPWVNSAGRWKKLSDILSEFVAVRRELGGTKICLDHVANTLLLGLPRTIGLALDFLNFIAPYVKRAIKEIIFFIIERILGFDPRDLRNLLTTEDLNNLSTQFKALLMEKANSLKARSSLQIRTTNTGDLLPHLGNHRVIPYTPRDQFPPSHSEISKDHPHSTHRSPFYEIHHNLARHAVKHISYLMHETWANSNNPARIVNNTDTLLDGLVPGLEELTNLADREHIKKVTEKNFLSRVNITRNLRPAPDSDLNKIFKAVDLYISHPEASNWWHETIKEEMRLRWPILAQDIHARNQTIRHRDT